MSDEENQEVRYQRKRRMTKRQLQRKVKHSQKRLDRLRVLYKLILVLLMLGLCIFILKMPQWRLKKNAFDSMKSPALEIVNNKIVPEQKILSAIRRNQVPLRPIFLVKTNDIRDSIKQLEPIQNVYIRRFWNPARLQIIVLERTPVITISPDINVPPIAFFSSDGKLIGREYMPLSSEFKTVLVITYGSGDDYRTWDIKKINNFKKLAAFTEAETGEKVEYIDYRNPKDVYMKIPTANVRLGTLSIDTINKIQRLPSLIPQVKMLNKAVKYIDLRWDTSYIKLLEE